MNTLGPRLSAAYDSVKLFALLGLVAGALAARAGLEGARLAWRAWGPR